MYRNDSDLTSSPDCVCYLLVMHCIWCPNDIYRICRINIIWCLCLCFVAVDRYFVLEVHPVFSGHCKWMDVARHCKTTTPTTIVFILVAVYSQLSWKYVNKQIRGFSSEGLWL